MRWLWLKKEKNKVKEKTANVRKKYFDKIRIIEDQGNWERGTNQTDKGGEKI